MRGSNLTPLLRVCCSASPTRRPAMPSVFLFATLDTKGREADFVRRLLRSWGVAVTLVDVGALGTAAVEADITRRALFELGGTSLEASGAARTAARPSPWRRAARRGWRAKRFAAGDLQGVLGLGGSAGTTIATAAMQALPLGVPKVMVSTLASGTVRQFVGDKDIFMLNAGRRHPRPQPRQPAGAVAGRRGDGRAGQPSAAAAAGRQADGRGDDVRGDDAVRRTGARDAGAGWLRGPRLPCDRQRRTGDGVADRRRHDCRRAGPHDDRAGGRARRRLPQCRAATV